MQNTNRGAKAAIAALACTTVVFGALFVWQFTKNGQSQARGNFTFYDFFPENEPRDKCFVAVKPAA